MDKAREAVAREVPARGPGEMVDGGEACALIVIPDGCPG